LPSRPAITPVIIDAVTTTDAEVVATATPPASHGSHTSFTYKPALDGLRAIAVLSVLAYHFGADWAQGGFLGVDMFFVLSGYLITSLLLVEWARTGRIQFAAFWARRARRLLPALFLVLMVVAIWARIELPSNQWRAIRLDAIWTFLYTANWHFIVAGQSYFSSTPSPLRHTWSLAIEEQFYLVWPLIVLGALYFARGKHWLLTTVCGAGIVGSLVVLSSTYHEDGDPSRPYYGTDARASQLLVGALLAILLLRWQPRARSARLTLQWLALAAAILIAYAFVEASDRGAILYHGGFLVFALCTAVVVAAIVQETRSPLKAGLSLAPIQWVGRVSYGIYLWHWPIAVALTPQHTGISGWQLDLLRVGATFIVAALSYYLVELPIRQRRFKRVWTPRIALPAAAALTIAVILVATAGAAPPDPLAARPGTVIATDRDSAPPIAANTGAPTERTLLLGDSVAYTLGDALTAAAAEQGVTFQAITRLGCGMTTGVALTDEGDVISWSPGCAADTSGYVQRSLAEANPDAVMWLSSWELSSYEVDGKALEFGTKPFDKWLNGEIDKVRTAVEEAGARLVLVQIPPQAPNPESEVKPEQAIRTKHLNRLFAGYARSHPENVSVVSLSDIVCPGGVPCRTTVDGIVLRPKDGGHYEAEGAAWVAPRLIEELFAALRTLDARNSSTTTTTTR
jgi:peptidoglycan/LPS O-acetylase OafA/YrhL